MHNRDCLKLLNALMACRSITPDDAGCQKLIQDRLSSVGFTERPLPFEGVENIWISHGSGAPVFAFVGHTDVVPPGPEEQWSSNPFKPTARNGRVYGRGAADMKGSLAAMVESLRDFVTDHPNHSGTVALLVTSDEEGPALNGTRRVVETIYKEGLGIDYCLVGEPSSISTTGDEIRIGRRGSLTGSIKVHGHQGHVAYPEHTDNALHRITRALEKLITASWPSGDESFPPLSFQVVNFSGGTGAVNVVPGEATAQFNFRYPPPITPDQLKTTVETTVSPFLKSYELTWRDGGRPFLSAPGPLRNAVVESIKEETGRDPVLSTGGGTSDGRFIAPYGTEVIELGPVRTSIHKIDEWISETDLDLLFRLYIRILGKLLLT